MKSQLLKRMNIHNSRKIWNTGWIYLKFLIIQFQQLKMILGLKVHWIKEALYKLLRVLQASLPLTTSWMKLIMIVSWIENLFLKFKMKVWLHWTVIVPMRIFRPENLNRNKVCSNGYLKKMQLPQQKMMYSLKTH